MDKDRATCTWRIYYSPVKGNIITEYKVLVYFTSVS